MVVILLCCFASNLLLLGHILPIAIGHQCQAESSESWAWFLSKIQEAYPMFEHGALLMDRDKGGNDATEYACSIEDSIHLTLA